MFWGAEEENSINKILNGGDVDFYEILRDPYCVEEIRVSNTKLIEFFTRQDVMYLMFNEILFTSSDDSENIAIEQQYFYAQKALNVFTALNENSLSKYLEDETIASYVTEYLLTENEKKNSLTIGFYTTMLETLFRNCLNIMTEFLRSTRILEGLLRNIHYSSVVEFLSNILSYATVTKKNIEIQGVLDDHHFTERLFVTFSKQKDIECYRNSGQILISLAEQLHEVYKLSGNVNDDIILRKIYDKSQWTKLLNILTDVSLKNIHVLYPISEVLTSLLNVYIDDRNPSRLYNYSSSKDQLDISTVYDTFEYDKIEELIRNKQHSGEAYKYDASRCVSTYTGKLFLMIKSIREKDVLLSDKICTRIMLLLAAAYNSSDSVTQINGINSLVDDDTIAAVFKFFQSISLSSGSPYMQCAIKDFIRNVVFYANKKDEGALILYILSTFDLTGVLLNEISQIQERDDDVTHNMSLAFYVSLLKIIYDGANYSCSKDIISSSLVDDGYHLEMKETFKKYPQYIFQDILSDFGGGEYDDTLYDDIEYTNHRVNSNRKITHIFPDGRTYETTTDSLNFENYPCT
uniref:FPL domain-containing protein n=1 Tax=Strongyloides papillosus TaxID=174720 RepID=A0A0N5B9H3_STREA